MQFIDWYNNEYRHSRIRFVTPNDVMRKDADFLMQRHALYLEARRQHPSDGRGIRNWRPIGPVTHNPQRWKRGKKCQLNQVDATTTLTNTTFRARDRRAKPGATQQTRTRGDSVNHHMFQWVDGGNRAAS